MHLCYRCEQPATHLLHDHCGLYPVWLCDEHAREVRDDQIAEKIKSEDDGD